MKKILNYISVFGILMFITVMTFNGFVESISLWGRFAWYTLFCFSFAYQFFKKELYEV